MAREIDVIRLDQKNTVSSLRAKLSDIAVTEDSGFPILRRDANDEGMRMVGYIGSNELEHALSMFHYTLCHLVSNWLCRPCT